MIDPIEDKSALADRLLDDRQKMALQVGDLKEKYNVLLLLRSSANSPQRKFLEEAARPKKAHLKTVHKLWSLTKLIILYLHRRGNLPAVWTNRWLCLQRSRCRKILEGKYSCA
jgi:hypothetical protein